MVVLAQGFCRRLGGESERQGIFVSGYDMVIGLVKQCVDISKDMPSEYGREMDWEEQFRDLFEELVANKKRDDLFRRWNPYFRSELAAKHLDCPGVADMSIDFGFSNGIEDGKAMPDKVTLISESVGFCESYRFDPRFPMDQILEMALDSVMETLGSDCQL